MNPNDTANLEKLTEKLNSGNYLFKYCTFSVNTLQVLINNSLYFASPDSLNDPLDCGFELQIVNPEKFTAETRKNMQKSHFYLDPSLRWDLMDIGLYQANMEKLKRFFNSYVRYIDNEHYGICCFSTKWENNLLWSHYANEARGIVIVFNKDKLIKTLKDSLSDSHYILKKNPVKYEPSLADLEIKLLDEGGVAPVLYKHFFIKTLPWKYEDEFRIVLIQTPASFFHPIQEKMIRLISFNPECIEYVIAGERIKNEHKDILVKLLGEEKVLYHKFN